MPTSPPLILALSGISSSGKTTIANQLLRIFSTSTTALLHADDFYHPESALPFRNGFRDWDCAQSLDIDALRQCLEGWKRGEGVGAGRKSQGGVEDGVHGGGGVGEMGLEGVVERLKGEVEKWWVEARGEASSSSSSSSSSAASTPSPQWPSLLILDGFLLLTPALESLHPLFDIKILLRASYAAAKTRREARNGYVTLDGFWQDPPGYFDAVVWPGYVEGHEGFFEGGDVDGAVREGVCGEVGIEVQPAEMGRENGLGEVLEWVVGIVKASMVK